MIEKWHCHVKKRSLVTKAPWRKKAESILVLKKESREKPLTSGEKQDFGMYKCAYGGHIEALVLRVCFKTS